MTDCELLTAYARTRADDPFQTLVTRHLPLVYAACLRQLRDRHLAQDASQVVFLVLSHKAPALQHSPAPLQGWLLLTARYACSTIRKSEIRRKRRETVTAMSHDATSSDTPDDLLPKLDHALCRLRPADRDALMLRYFQDQPLASVGQSLGISEEAARKRVDRALDKLRDFFSHRGIQPSVLVLGKLLADCARTNPLPPDVQSLLIHQILNATHATTALTTLAKGVSMRMFLNSGKAIATAAAALALSIALAAHSFAAKPPAAAPQAATPQAAAAVAPATGPAPPDPFGAAATEPALLPDVDLATPESALASLSRALKAGDRDKAYQCLTADPRRNPTPIDVMIAWDLAENRMKLAARKAFGPGGDVLQTGMPVELFLDVMLALQLKSQIDGNSAILRFELPQEILNQLPAQSQQDATAWLGAPVRFVKLGSRWKVDIDHTAQVVIDSDPTALSRRDILQRNIAWGTDFAKSLDDFAAELDQGRYPDIALAASELQARFAALLQKHEIYGFKSRTLLPLDSKTQLP